MLQVQTNAGNIIIAVVLMLVVLVVFMLVLVSYFHNRKLNNIREKELLKKDFDKALMASQLEVQEQTMRQISQEIHDNIGQILSLVNLNLKTLKEGEKEKIDTTAALVNKAITDLRSLSKSLNPDLIVKAGLVQMVQNDLDQMQKTGQFTTDIDVSGEPVLPAEKLIILYRMIQEVLNNIMKHAGANRVSVAITPNKISINDNGKGFDTRADSKGLGLQNLKQRGKLIDAVVNIESVIDKGTNVTFNLNIVE